MTTTTIIMPSGRQEKCAKPGNCKRHDPHRATGGSSRAAFLKDVTAHTQPSNRAKGTNPSGQGKEQPKPIVVKPSELREPSGSLISYEVPDDRYPNKFFELELDYTGSDDYYDDANVRIHTANIHAVHHLPEILARVFGAGDVKNVPVALVNYAKAEGLDKPEAYNLSINEGDDYYGGTDDTYSIALKDENLAKLETWYYNQPNAVDSQGILNYARGKGIDTTGLTPFQAIKAQLIAEHPKLADKIEKATYVTTAMIARGDINQVDEKRLNNATKIKDWANTAYPTATTDGTPRNFEGVVYSTRKRGGYGFERTYRLLDGFNRYKSRTTKRTTARYIVLGA